MAPSGSPRSSHQCIRACAQDGTRRRPRVPRDPTATRQRHESWGSERRDGHAVSHRRRHADQPRRASRERPWWSSLIGERRPGPLVWMNQAARSRGEEKHTARAEAPLAAPYCKISSTLLRRPCDTVFQRIKQRCRRRTPKLLVPRCLVLAPSANDAPPPRSLAVSNVRLGRWKGAAAADTQRHPWPLMQHRVLITKNNRHLNGAARALRAPHGPRTGPYRVGRPICGHTPLAR